jgi:hypothetical protein
VNRKEVSCLPTTKKKNKVDIIPKKIIEERKDPSSKDEERLKLFLALKT